MTSNAHDHSHGAGALRAGARHQKRLLIVFVLVGVFLVVEAIAGMLTNSLALLSDAGHMLTDVIGLGMALAAIQLANRHSRRVDASQQTFGMYRLEILAAFVNALLLFGVAIFVLIEAVGRIGSTAEVLGTPMLIVASVGLAVNLIAFALLRQGASESLNVEGAYLEVLADTLGSVGVIVAAVLLQLFGWTWVDAVIGAGIGLWILPRTWRIGGQAVRILLQAAPPHIDLQALRGDLAALPAVVDVHDLHVWTLTSDMESASAHLVVDKVAATHDVLDQARSLFRDRYGIDHATLQVEPADHKGCDQVSW